MKENLRKKQDGEFSLLIVATFLLIFINACNPYFENYFWGSVLNAILIGIIVSYIFYYIVVYTPNKKRENIIKNNYKKQIQLFKSNIISKLLQSLTGGYVGKGGWNHEDLFVNGKFREFFETKISSTQDRWDDISTNLQGDRDRVDDILMEFKFLEDESVFLLNNLEIKDERVYVFLKKVSKITYSLRKYDPNVDDIKPLMMFLWQIFAGWSWIDGYSEEDIFEIINAEF